MFFNNYTFFIRKNIYKNTTIVHPLFENIYQLKSYTFFLHKHIVYKHTKNSLSF